MNRKVGFLSIFIVLWLAYYQSVQAQQINRTYISEKVKASYKYRDDISSDVLRTAKQWSSPGVPHSDWIERKGGKSIDLQGNPLFPEIDYSYLTEELPGKFVISKNENTHGFIDRNGKLLMPIAYKHIDYKQIRYGLLIGTKTDGNVDIYTTEGLFLCSLSHPVALSCKYDRTENLIMIQYKAQSSDNIRHFLFFFADGQPACGEFIAKSTSIYRASEGKITAKDATSTEHTVYMFDYPQNHWKLQDGDLEIHESMAQQIILNNYWLKKAAELFGQGKYSEAAECINYFKDFDGVFKFSYADTSLSYMLCQMLMNCYYQAKDYRTIIEGVDQPNVLTSKFVLWEWGFMKDDETGNKFYYIGDFSREAKAAIIQYANTCKNIYQNSLPAYQNQQAQQARYAQLWGNLLNDVTQRFNKAASNYQRQAKASTATRAVPGFDGLIDQSSINGVPAALLPPTEDELRSQSSSKTSSSNNRKEKQTPRSCTFCKGTGQVEVNRSVGTFGLDTSKKQCPTCGKTIMGGNSHTHTTCTHCMGSGKAR